MTKKPNWNSSLCCPFNRSLRIFVLSNDIECELCRGGNSSFFCDHLHSSGCADNRASNRFRVVRACARNEFVWTSFQWADHCLFTCKWLPATRMKNATYFEDSVFALLEICGSANKNVYAKQWNHLLFMCALWKKDISSSFKWRSHRSLSCGEHVFVFSAVLLRLGTVFSFRKSCAIWMANGWYFLLLADWQQQPAVTASEKCVFFFVWI